jgi:hypothetical protein
MKITKTRLTKIAAIVTLIAGVIVDVLLRIADKL